MPMSGVMRLNQNQDESIKSVYIVASSIVGKDCLHCFMISICGAETMFTLYRIAVRSVTNCISDRVFVHT